MIKSSAEILEDIDATLDKLIENADTIKEICINPVFTQEIEALQKTQESLLARLVHMNDHLASDPVKKEKSARIEDKLVRFGKLNAEMIEQVSRTLRNNRPVVRPHRKRLKVR